MSNKFYPSIFNDVLSPRTQGPSSSNTVGPYRIGELAKCMVDDIKKVKFTMSKNGGFKDTFFSMDSDKGLLLGLMGLDLLDFGLDKVYQEAKKRGIEYEFVFSDSVPNLPSEMGILELNDELTLTGVSLGGGEIEITEINGVKTNLSGRSARDYDIPKVGKKHLISVYPLSVLENPNPPFYNAATMIEYCKKNNKTVFDAAMDYEMALTGAKYDEILNLSKKALEIEYKGIKRGLKGGFSFSGITNPMAKDIKEKINNTKLFNLGLGNLGGLDSLAIMEYSNSHGEIVCMPTGGATGIIPSTIKAASNDLGLTIDDEIKALVVAGMIGAFFYETHYHGGLGCQAEVGIATSMASAGICSMLTDDPLVIEKAAVLSMQYIIGQVCDPIKGYVQIPCFIRNIVSVSVATSCANYAILGLDSGVGLDHMVDATLRVGIALRKDRINDLGTCMECSNCGKC